MMVSVWWAADVYGIANKVGPDGLLLRFQKLNKDQRALFLTGLIGDLALEEASTITRRIEPRLRRDFLKELPLELALHCMSFVSTHSG
jgi:F-box and WD-40 domain protein CDC4